MRLSLAASLSITPSTANGALLSSSSCQEDFAREETPKKILKALKEIDLILAKPEPTISVSGLSEKHITLTVHFWIARGQHSVVTEALYALRAALPNADLTVMEAAGDI